MYRCLDSTLDRCQNCCQKLLLSKFTTATTGFDLIWPSLKATWCNLRTPLNSNEYSHQHTDIKCEVRLTEFQQIWWPHFWWLSLYHHQSCSSLTELDNWRYKSMAMWSNLLDNGVTKSCRHQSGALCCTLECHSILCTYHHYLFNMQFPCLQS